MNRIIRMFVVALAILAGSINLTFGQTLEVDYANFLSEDSSDIWSFKLQPKANDHIKAEVRGGEVSCPPCALAGYAVCTDSNNCPSSATTSKMVSCGAMTVQQALALQQAQIALAAMQSGEVSPVIHFPDEGPTFTVTSQFFDKYRGGNGGLFYNGAVNQSDIFVAFPNGLYGDFWVSRGGKGRWMGDFDSEVDVNAGWANETFDFGTLYIVTADLAPSDVLELYAKVSVGIGHGVRLHFAFEHYLAMDGNDPARGTITRLGLKGSATIGRGKLDWGLGGFYDTGAFGFAEGTVGEGKASLLYSIGQLSLGPVVKCTAPISLSRDDGRTAGCAAGLLLKTGF